MVQQARLLLTMLASSRGGRFKSQLPPFGSSSLLIRLGDPIEFQTPVAIGGTAPEMEDLSLPLLLCLNKYVSK